MKLNRRSFFKVLVGLPAALVGVVGGGGLMRANPRKFDLPANFFSNRLTPIQIPRNTFEDPTRPWPRPQIECIDCYIVPAPEDWTPGRLLAVEHFAPINLTSPQEGADASTKG